MRVSLSRGWVVLDGCLERFLMREARRGSFGEWCFR